MGWGKVCELESRSGDIVVSECGLWTRGGLEGVQVMVGRLVIDIPREVILRLVADEYVNKKIARYEQMTAEQAVDEMMGFDII